MLEHDMKIKQLSLLLLMVLFSSLMMAQQKYAVIISGVATSWNLMHLPSGLSGNITNTHQFDEFWNNTYLVWELLTQKYGYNNENIILLYGNGDDWHGINPIHENEYFKAERYGLNKITDYSADSVSLSHVFNTLYKTLKSDDILLVLTIGAENQGNLTGKTDLNLQTGVITKDYLTDRLIKIASHTTMAWLLPIQKLELLLK
jgi:hypothetical protein